MTRVRGGPAPGQGDILAAFEAGRVEGFPGPATCISTHLSHVFLAGERAAKLKRAVRLPFADFSTLAAREAACRAELALNRRTAPGLYLDVVPVTRGADGGFALGGGGEIADWIVLMRRFPDGALFEEMARAGRLSVGLVEETAEAVARFHAGLPPVRAQGACEPLGEVLAGLGRTAADGARRHGIAAPPHALFGALDARLAAIEGPLARRREAGAVRHGHGDLHLRNICLVDGRPTPFDALEFDARLATGDVLYDLAFLLMDLRHHGLHAHANAALNRYWDVSGESEGALALVAPLMALRAVVRLAVSLEAGDAAAARSYGGLARDLTQTEEPRLVAIGGLSGTGKSLAAKSLAPLLPGPCGARLLRTDVLRKEGRGEGPLGREAYTDERRLGVYAALAERAGAALAGTSAIADGTFREDEARARIAAVSPTFAGLWLHAPLEVRLARVAGRVADASDATPEVAARQSEPDGLGPGWTRLPADGSPRATLERACAVLGLPRPS
ncbi:MAG: AAA family ATPase [Alphaproteobacteria bacterium]|nr:AAA family ATPase [Alphaproteobacteria bacterium]